MTPTAASRRRPVVYDGDQESWAPEAQALAHQNAAAAQAANTGGQANRATRRAAAKDAQAAKTWIPALAALLAVLPVVHPDGAPKDADGIPLTELALTPGAIATHLAALLLWQKRGERDITAAEVAAATGRPLRSIRKAFASQLGPVDLWKVSPLRRRLRPAASYAQMVAGECGIYGQVPVRLVRTLCRGAADDEDKPRRRFAALRLAVHLAVSDFRHGDIPHTHRHLGDDIGRRTRAAGGAARLLRRLGLINTETAAEEIDGLHYRLIY